MILVGLHIPKDLNTRISRQQFLNPNPAAYSNNEINSDKNHETYTCFSAVVRGETHSKIDDLSICPPNNILYLFRLLVIPYTCKP